MGLLLNSPFGISKIFYSTKLTKKPQIFLFSTSLTNILPNNLITAIHILAVHLGFVISPVFLQEDQLIPNRRMTDKKNLCRYDDYIDSKAVVGSYHAGGHSCVLPEFKLDKIYPKNINIKLNQESFEGLSGCAIRAQGKIDTQNTRSSQAFKFFNSTENKFYHQYMNAKEHHNRSSLKKNKIAHIFNIRSINLIEKIREKADQDNKQKMRAKHSSKEIKRSADKDKDRDNLKALNLILVEKRNQHSPDREFKRFPDKKNSVPYMQKMHTENKSLVTLKTDNNFETKLADYHAYVRENCALHGLTLKEVESYARNSLVFQVGRGNNGNLIKELLKKRWWWTMIEEKDKGKRMSNFIWTQLKEKSYYLKDKSYCLKQQRSKSSISLKRSDSTSKMKDLKNQAIITSSQALSDIADTKIHNHFECNQFLGNKKALYYNMKAFYQRQGKNVFDHLPVTFHVKRYDDDAWKEFAKYYAQDMQSHAGEGDAKRLWIVKPGENSNRGNGITIYSDFQKIREWVVSEISGSNNPKKTFIIQKYIDRPFLYNKRKFDIRCYMLLARLNGKIKGYWYDEGYIRTSCYEFQLNDTQNEFIHLTNDAIQVNSDKYGKYEDGNKLSYHNFQKFLDNTQKNLRFVEEICPQLKRIGTDSIEATYQLLGKWNSLPTFEIFGLDFMIDQNFKPWLIEINTNPCLETSSTTLERVIPRMVDNAFKLTLDLLFPPPQNWQNSKKHYLPNRIANNLFQLVFDQDKIGNTHSFSQEIILEMGEIEQDNEVYDEKAPKEDNVDFNQNQ